MSRIATVFQVEYYGDFTPSGNENGRIRFYANDGPGPPGAHMPGNLLYDSGPFSLFPGYNTVTLSGFSVIVPDDFTWSVQFSGLSGSVGSTAGLLLSPVPSVGRSYRDFWLKGGSGWQLLEINGGDLKANFGARLYATQDLTIHLSAPVTLGNGANQFQISGPYGRTCILQATSDLITWHSLSRVTFPSAPFLFTDPQGLSLNRRFYRAVLVSDDPMTVGAPTRSTNGQVQVQVFGPSGFNYILQASADLVHWSGLVTNTFTTRPVQVLDTSAPAFGKRFYRTVLGP